MRVFLRSLAILAIALALAPMAQAAPAASQPDTVDTGDELVIITSAGRLQAVDPYVPANYQTVVWESPETGFIVVSTGDFNGDGSAEVVGLRGGEAVVYDPVLRPGEPNTERVFRATSGQTWRNVTTGDFDGNGSDELVLVESSSGSGVQMLAFGFNASTGWNQIFSQRQGAGWQALVTGDVMGNNRDQVVGTRNVGTAYQILIFDPANNWQVIHDRANYGFPWVALAVGNMEIDPTNRDEIATTRSGTGAAIPSFFVFRWVPGSSSLADVVSGLYNPEFRWIALADVNGNGDDEAFLLRPGNSNGVSIVALTNYNVGTDTIVPFNELAGQTKWNGIQGGDVDADGKDEVIVMSPDEYLIYYDPAVSTVAVPTRGSFINNGIFAVGDLDGPGTPTSPALSVSPLTIDLNLQFGQNASTPVTIANTGAGTLNWTATVVDGAAWLSISSPSGTAPSTLQVLVSTGGVAPGAYVGRVRIDAPGATGTPQTITVNLNVTAPPFAAQPGTITWLYQPPVNPGVQTVTVSGQNVAWHAGVVPTSAADQVERAVAAGQAVKLQDGQLIIGDGRAAETVPVVNWVDINPVSGVATPGGILVDVSLVLDRVPNGFRSFAVVFVADTVASPPAVVVRGSTLRSQPNGSDLYFLPMIMRQ
jgi:hypothetical protein